MAEVQLLSKPLLLFNTFRQFSHRQKFFDVSNVDSLFAQRELTFVKGAGICLSVRRITCYPVFWFVLTRDEIVYSESK